MGQNGATGSRTIPVPCVKAAAPKKATKAKAKTKATKS